MVPKLTQRQLEQLKRCFEVIDSERAGEIDVSDLFEAFEMLGIHMTQKKAALLMARVDRDGSGTLDFKEFIETMTICLAAGLDDVTALLDNSDNQRNRMSAAFRDDSQRFGNVRDAGLKEGESHAAKFVSTRPIAPSIPEPTSKFERERLAMLQKAAEQKQREQQAKASKMTAAMPFDMVATFYHRSRILEMLRDGNLSELVALREKTRLEEEERTRRAELRRLVETRSKKNREATLTHGQSLNRTRRAQIIDELLKSTQDRMCGDPRGEHKNEHHYLGVRGPRAAGGSPTTTPRPTGDIYNKTGNSPDFSHINQNQNQNQNQIIASTSTSPEPAEIRDMMGSARWDLTAPVPEELAVFDEPLAEEYAFYAAHAPPPPTRRSHAHSPAGATTTSPPPSTRSSPSPSGRHGRRHDDDERTKNGPNVATIIDGNHHHPFAAPFSSSPDRSSRFRPGPHGPSTRTPTILPDLTLTPLLPGTKTNVTNNPLYTGRTNQNPSHVIRPAHIAVPARVGRATSAALRPARISLRGAMLTRGRTKETWAVTESKTKQVLRDRDRTTTATTTATTATTATK